MSSAWRGGPEDGPHLEVWGRDGDPFALPLSSPVDEFERRRMGSSPMTPSTPGASGSPPAPAPASGLDQVGRRAAATLDAIDFPSFVAGLISGTFDAIVKSSAQQMRAFSELVSSLAQTVDDFATQNVTPPQVRAWLVETYPQDLAIEAGPTGSQAAPKLVPTRASYGKSPAWLSRFDMAGEELSDELANGRLVDRARRSLAEQRMQQLSTLVLMGMSRIVIERGDITAKLTFHIDADESSQVAMGTGQSQGAAGIASTYGSQSPARLSVSTGQANAQRQASVRADLVGQVSVRFATETFPLERFADSAAIQLINAHARPMPKQPPAEKPKDEPAKPAPKDGGA